MLEQVPIEAILHCNTFIPSPIPVTVVLGLVEFVMTAVPDIKLQVPAPVVGVLAAKVVELVVIQIVCDGPALAIDVAGSTCIVIVDVVLEQVPAEVMLHCKTLVPSVKPVTVLVGLLVVVIVAPPLITDQVPVPVVGVLAAKVVELVVIQIV